MTTPRFAPGTLHRGTRSWAARCAMLAAQSGVELRLALRGGEQVLLTLLIPMVLLVGLTLVTLVPLPDPRIAAVTPCAGAGGDVTAFTRRPSRSASTALRRDPTAGRHRPPPLAARGRTAGGGAGGRRRPGGRARGDRARLGLAARPRRLGWAVLLVLLGCAAFGALGILVGGTLRAEVTLAVANLIWLVLVLVGGIVVPVDEMPHTRPPWRSGCPPPRSPTACASPSPPAPPRPGSRCWSCVVWACWRAAAAVRLVRWR